MRSVDYWSVCVVTGDLCCCGKGVCSWGSWWRFKELGVVCVCDQVSTRRDLITNTHNPQLLKPPSRTSATHTPPTARWAQTSSHHTNRPVKYSIDRTDKHHITRHTATTHTHTHTHAHTLHIISFFTVQKTICCNSTSNAPDDGRMYPKYVELRIYQ